MEFTIHRISLDIHSAKSQTTLRVKQADTNRKLHITLCEGGLPYHIAEDCYADFSALKADGNYIFNNCLIEGNTIEYTFTAQTTAAVGAMNCEITLYSNDGQRITSPRFTIIVEERVYNGEAIVSSPEANALDELINRAEHAVDNAEKFVDSFNFRVNNTFANAFKRKVSGGVVQVDDVSPVEHIVGCRVKSKNLWKTHNITATYSRSSDIVYTYNNGVFTYAGTVKNNAGGGRNELGEQSWAKVILPPGTYTYFLNVISGNTGGLSTFMQAIKNNTTTILPNYTFSLTEETEILFGINRPTTIGKEYNVAFNIMLVEGTEATEYSPYIDVSTVEVDRNGESFSVAADGTVNGLTSVSPSMTVSTDDINAIVEIEYNRDSNKVFAELYKYIEQGGITPKVARIVNVTILADKWVGSSSPYSQVVTVDGATKYSQVDLTPDAEQLAIFHNKDLAFVTENENGVITVYAIGQKPTNDYTMQATVTEVNV